MLKRLNFLWLAPVSALIAAPACAEPSAANAAPSAAQSYEPKPALWLLEDADTKIYLFGTVHILPPGFRWRSPALDEAAASADELVVETASGPETAEEDLRSLSGMMLEEPRPILERVPKRKRAKLKSAIAASKLPIEFYDSMRTWAAGMMIGMGQLLGSYGTDSPEDAPGVEAVLEAEFKKAGKPVVSVEDGDLVFASFNALPEAIQAELLISAIDDPGQGLEESAEDDHFWARGDYEKLALDDPKLFPPAVFDVLVRKRNAAWTDWLAKRLERPGTVLFAVGAGHLAGRESVQDMLAGRGLAVKRVN